MPDRTFAGLEIHGEIYSSDRNNKIQLPKEDLAEPLRIAIQHPKFVAFHWHQYTPYFNDGEPCYFSTGDLFVRLLHDDEESVDLDEERERIEEDGSWQWMDDGENKWVYASYLTDGRHSYDWVGGELVRTQVEPPPSGVEDIVGFCELFTSGNYENALLELFGDHADVLITRDKIVVEEFEHE